MATQAKQYRDHLYHHRSHPNSNDFTDQRDSLWTIYLSVIPFLCGEYIIEATSEVIPAGLVFPLGYVLFWAFYYTYYKPNFLEERLKDVSSWHFAEIPALIIGIVIWFVKISFVQFVSVVILSWWDTPKRVNPNERRRPHRPAPIHRQARQAPEPLPELPIDLQKALSIMGLRQCRNWNEIHHRYRELAKQFHPDLNPEITRVGRRFMNYDAAYRKLFSVKERYFPEK